MVLCGQSYFKKYTKKTCCRNFRIRAEMQMMVSQDYILKKLNQGHFLSTHCFPPSSYSCFEIHICWKVP